MLRKLALAIKRRTQPRKSHIRLVRAPALAEGYFTTALGNTLAHSSFSIDWLAEAGVDPTVIVDVGSFDGGDAYRFKTAFPEARVIAVEADPFRAGIVRNSLDGSGAEVLEYAVQQVDGPVAFYVATIAGEPSAQGSIFKLTEKEAAKRHSIQQSDVATTVQGRRIDSLVADLGITEVDLLHMDIQGAEYEALLGLGVIRPRVLFLEVDAQYEGVKPASALHALVADMGYWLAAELPGDRLYFRSDIAL